LKFRPVVLATITAVVALLTRPISVCVVKPINAMKNQLLAWTITIVLLENAYALLAPSGTPFKENALKSIAVVIHLTALVNVFPINQQLDGVLPLTLATTSPAIVPIRLTTIALLDFASVKTMKPGAPVPISALLLLNAVKSQMIAETACNSKLERLSAKRPSNATTFQPSALAITTALVEIVCAN